MTFVVGNVYLVPTTLTRDRPKPKFAVCVRVDPEQFVWINTNPSHDGLGQVPIAPGEHDLIRQPSFIDLGRLIAHPPHELESSSDEGPLPESVLQRIVTNLEAVGRSKLTPRMRGWITESLRLELARRAVPKGP